MMPHELRFDPLHDWRFDFAWKEGKCAVEYHGDDHHRTTRYVSDRRKANRAQLLGWLYIEITHCMLIDGSALSFLRDAFIARGIIDPFYTSPQRFLRDYERSD